MKRSENEKRNPELPDNKRGNVGAFFDLDKTILDGATLLIMAPTLYRNGLIKLPTLVRAGIGAKVYERFGANDARTEKMKRVGLKIVEGWDHGQIMALVEGSLEGKFSPRIFHEARELVRSHREQGHIIVVVSSSPIELVQPIARSLGIDNVIATRIRLDKDGKCTNEFAVWVSGQSKRGEIHDLAEALDIDLPQSSAYSDSHLDIPMLETVGNPVAVNPDKKLELHARANGWTIHRFDKPGIADPSPAVHPGRNIVSDHRVQAGVGIGVAVATGITGFALSRRFSPAHS